VLIGSTNGSAGVMNGQNLSQKNLHREVVNKNGAIEREWHIQQFDVRRDHVAPQTAAPFAPYLHEF